MADLLDRWAGKVASSQQEDHQDRMEGNAFSNIFPNQHYEMALAAQTIQLHSSGQRFGFWKPGRTVSNSLESCQHNFATFWSLKNYQSFWWSNHSAKRSPCANHGAFRCADSSHCRHLSSHADVVLHCVFHLVFRECPKYQWTLHQTSTSSCFGLWSLARIIAPNWERW